MIRGVPSSQDAADNSCCNCKHSLVAAGRVGGYNPANPTCFSVDAAPMTEITCILSAIEQGEPHAAGQLLPLVYEELRKLAAQKLAHEKPGQTLQGTALVHEAYLRLVDTDKVSQWNSRGHFFAAAAEAMRRILIEGARSKAREKRGGNWQRVDFEELDVATAISPDQPQALACG